MVKNIIKEIIIVLLLTLVIILILGVLLYEYVPANKIIPEKVSYGTPENVQEELKKDDNVNDTEIIITYQIDSTDLNNYKRIQEYVPGKKNPFESLNNKEISENTVNNNTSTGANTTQNNNTVESSGYLPEKGTK